QVHHRRDAARHRRRRGGRVTLKGRKVAIAGREFPCGDYSIAGMCNWIWIDKYPDNGGGPAARRPGGAAVQRALAAGLDLIASSREDGSSF
ncbi:MAG: hypothetical protein QM681_09415, partial [Novosphingobium sp.]